MALRQPVELKCPRRHFSRRCCCCRCWPVRSPSPQSHENLPETKRAASSSGNSTPSGTRPRRRVPYDTARGRMKPSSGCSHAAQQRAAAFFASTHSTRTGPAWLRQAQTGSDRLRQARMAELTQPCSSAGCAPQLHRRFSAALAVEAATDTILARSHACPYALNSGDHGHSLHPHDCIRTPNML